MSTPQISSCSHTGANGINKDDTSKLQVQQALRAGVLDALGVKDTAGGIHGIATALRDLLANADPDAPDPVPGVLKTINTALESTAKKLADQGVDQASIDAAVKRFRSQLARELDSLTPAGSATAATSSSVSAAAVHAVVKEKFSLNILTAEGDRVSIRFRSSQVTDAAATRDAAAAQVMSRGRLKIEVDGDLSDSELTAIGDLLDKVDGIAQDFFGGDTQAAFAAAARVGFDSQQLSGFNLKLSYSQRIGFAQTYANVAATDVKPVASTAEVPKAAAPAELPAAPVPETTAIGDAAQAAPTPTPTPAGETPATPVETTAPAATADSAQQTIAKFAKDVLAKLSAVSDGGSARFTMRWKVEFLLTALAASKPATDTAFAASTAVLGDNLNNGITDVS